MESLEDHLEAKLRANYLNPPWWLLIYLLHLAVNMGLEHASLEKKG